MLIHARSGGSFQRALLAGLAILCIGLGLTACGSNPSADPPTITVVTGLWPLAQAAAAIGGSSVQVTDVVPAGANPLTWQPDATQRATIQNADVVLEIGGNFQPGFERAAKANARTMFLDGPLQVSNPYLWLNPSRMVRVARLVYQALNMSNPDAQATYLNGLSTFTQDLGEVDAAYAQVFGRCSLPVIVAEDSTLNVLRARFPFKLKSLTPTDKTWPTANTAAASTPDAATVTHQARVIRRSKVTAVIADTGAPSGYLDAAQQETGVKVVTLDTMATAPTGASGPASYLDGLSDNLKLIRAGIKC